MTTKAEISWGDFEKIDIRTGTILSAHPLPQARRPAYVLEIDFGALGVLKSSAQITDRYTTDQLVGQCVCAVVNFPPKQIGKLMSQCLVLGAVDAQGSVRLLDPGTGCPSGLPIA